MKKIFTVLFLVSSFAFGQSPGDLIITEWMANPATLADADGEYVEFYNTTSSTIDINGWVLKDDDTDSHTINNGGALNIPAGGFLVLAIGTSPGFTPDYVFSSTALANSGDEIVLMSGATEIARINYSNGDPFGAGTSAELNDIANHVNGVTQQSDYTAATENYNGDLGSPGSFGGTLPVELTTFSAVVINNNIELRWETATEINNYGFDVERASAPLSMTSPKDWNKVGFVNGHGNSNSPKNYSYVDNSVHSTGKYFYRLKQVDIDGSYEYSSMVEVDLTAQLDYKLNQNFPNPFNPTTTISFSLPPVETGNLQSVRLTVFNVLGEQVAQLVNKNMEAGNHNVEFNASELNSGIYVYKIEANGFVQTRKMMLVK